MKQNERALRAQGLEGVIRPPRIYEDYLPDLDEEKELSTGKGKWRARKASPVDEIGAGPAT